MSHDKYFLVEEDYDSVEHSFHNTYDSPSEFAGQITSFVGNLKAGDKLLNIGATLAECVYFLDRELDVTDVDISQSMVDYIAAKDPRVKVVKANVKDFDGSGYDAIWACRSLIHIIPSDIDMVLKKIHDSLSSTGTFGCIFFTTESKDIAIDEKPEPHTSQPDTTYYCVLYPPSIIEAKLEEAGFRLKKIEKCVDKDNDAAIYFECQK